MVGVPAAEAVALLRGRGLGDRRAVVLCDGGNGIAAVRIKGDGILVHRPLCLDGHAPRGHRDGDRLVPAREGVALPGRVCGRGDRRPVFLGDGRDRAAAVRIKGQGILADVPLGIEGRIFRGHGAGCELFRAI